MIKLPILGLALLLCASAPAPGTEESVDTKPPSVKPTAVSLRQVVRMHGLAVGEIDETLPKTRIEHWSTSAEGLEGSEEVVESGVDHRENDVMGPFQSASGTLRGTQWIQNENGLTRTLRDIHKEDAVNRSALHNALKDHHFVRIAGESSAPVAAYVVEVDPPGGRHEWVFYDKTTYLIVRTETLWKGRRLVTTYDDFRKTDGLTEAWHVHEADGRKYNDVDSQMKSLEIGVAVPDDRLAMPVNRRAIDEFPADKVDLPVRIIDDKIIIPLTIGGTTQNFQLDSGASAIVIDNTVSADLKLKAYGQLSSETAGPYLQSHTIIPQVTIGNLRMHDVVAESLPFHARVDEKTRIVGLLGYDFIAGAVIHIDYADEKLEAISAASFTPPAGAHYVEVALDDAVPFSGGAIGGVSAPNLIVDTGADRSTLFSTFVAHNSVLRDAGLGDAMVASSPFVSRMQGVGGLIEFRPLQIKGFSFANFTFPSWLFWATNEHPSFAGEDSDGLIGQDFLRNFDVYLDYSHERIWFRPNQRYVNRWGNP